MKIGIISAPLGAFRTGVPNYAYHLIAQMNNMSTQDISLSLIDYRRSELDTIFPSLNKINVPNKYSKISKMYLWYMSLPADFNANAYDFDIVHNPFQIPTFKKFKKHNYVFSIHDITPIKFSSTHSLRRAMIYRTFLPKTLRSADLLISGSQNTKTDVVNSFNISPEKIQVIPYGVDDIYRPTGIAEQSVTRDKYRITDPFILYVGTLEPRKNIPLLLKAFSKIKSQGDKHKLVIVGKQGWKHKVIYDLIEHLHLRNDVIFTGYVPEVELPYLYGAADVFVYPSIYEGFGLPPLEAMACGTPVITSNTSSLPEVVGDAGIMIDPYDVDGLVQAMHSILRDDTLKQELSKKGLERARKFSWVRCAKSTFQAYKMIT